MDTADSKRYWHQSWLPEKKWRGVGQFKLTHAKPGNKNETRIFYKIFASFLIRHRQQGEYLF
ncbi:MAG: hypothetical protein U5Q03_03710 [Bacteroidota bacterium]|nr:hypothetical protein [Bacteroidota bacterium]